MREVRTASSSRWSVDMDVDVNTDAKKSERGVGHRCRRKPRYDTNVKINAKIFVEFDVDTDLPLTFEIEV